MIWSTEQNSLFGDRSGRISDGQVVYDGTGGTWNLGGNPETVLVVCGCQWVDTSFMQWNGNANWPNWSGISIALERSGYFPLGAQAFSGAIVARFGNASQATLAIRGLDKFAFGPIGDALPLGDQFAQAFNDIQNGVDPGSALLGHGINAAAALGAGAFTTLATDALLGTVIGEGPWGTLAGLGVGASTVWGVSLAMPNGQEWSQSFSSEGEYLYNGPAPPF